MYGYIYLTINKINRKTYVGQKSFKGKKAWDKDGYLGSGLLIVKAIKKYGKENFEKFLIQFCNTKEELDKQETFWIAEYRKRNMTQYNIACGGHGSNGNKGKIPWNKGKHHSIESCLKMSESHKGKTFSKEHKEKISKSMKKALNSPEVKEKLRQASTKRWEKYRNATR